jgi:hypothetical protein
MSLCFVSNKDLTVPFSDLAHHLRECGENIVWLSPSTRWSRWLVSQGWPENKILNLPDFSASWQKLDIDASIATLGDLETDAPATISNIILMCRNLRRRPKRVAYGYLAVARRYIEAFLIGHGVEVVFGEATWGFELMAWLVCQKIGIPMVTPATTRIPSNRFYFADARSSALFQFTEITLDDQAWAERFLVEWARCPVQPDYVHDTQGYRSFDSQWLGELAIGIFRPKLDRHDETLWPLHLRIRDRVRRSLNAITYRYAQPHEKPPEGERYVLFCLQHQPESSIDVYGSLHSNQAALIETLSRLLPASHKLWVKEHIGALGDRSVSWYRAIAKLPNVRLIDPFRNIYGLVRSADMVITISGTVGYEAALLGVPALGLAPVFFGSLMSNTVSLRSHPLEWHFRALLVASHAADAHAQASRRCVDFLAQLHANSFVGSPTPLKVPSGQRAGPNYLKDEKNAFVAFTKALRGRQGNARRRNTEAN